MTAENHVSEFRAILEEVIEASKVPAKKRAVDAKSKAAELGSLAYKQGVLPDELDQLIDLITIKNHMDQASLSSLIKNLYPVSKVSQEVIFRILGSLGIGERKPSLTIQSQVLQWIILIYHVSDSKAQAALSRAYGVLFNLLDVSAIRPQLFHILALITRRKHVQHHRIQALVNLSRLSAKDGHLQGLLRVYRNYYPEIIVGTYGKSSTFKLPDPEWRDRLAVIQRQHREQQPTSTQGPQNGFKTNQNLSQYKVGKSAVIPHVQTSNAHEKSITLEEIDSAESLALNLEIIELPDHLVAVLADPLLQKLMMLKGNQGWPRAAAWMTTHIAEILAGDACEEIITNTLRVFHEYALATKVLHPIWVALLRLLDARPDFCSRNSLVRKIMPYHPLLDWDKLANFSFLLKYLDRPEVPCELDHLDIYTQVLGQWSMNLLSATGEIREYAGPTMASIITYVNGLCLTLVQKSPVESTYLRILDFYEQVAYVFSQPSLLKIVPVTVPPATLVYTLLFSQSLATVSRLCAILAVFKEAFATAMSLSSKKQGPGYDKRQVEIFNGFLMDICNCIWRGKAFLRSDPTAQRCLVSDPVIEALGVYVGKLEDDLALVGLFTLSYSPLLCLQSICHVRQLEDAEDEEVELHARHAGPVTHQSLTLLARKGGIELTWQDYRMGVLKRLEDSGVKGIPELLYCTMKNLREQRAKA